MQHHGETHGHRRVEAATQRFLEEVFMNIPKIFFWGCALILVATTTGYSQETSSTEEAAAFVRASVPWFSPDTYALERLTTSNRGWNVSLQLKDVEDDHRLHLYFSYWQGAIEGSAVTFIRASDWRDYVEATMPITEKTRALLLRVVQAAMDRPAPSQQSDETEFAYLPKVMELLRTATLPEQPDTIASWKLYTPGQGDALKTYLPWLDFSQVAFVEKEIADFPFGIPDTVFSDAADNRISLEYSSEGSYVVFLNGTSRQRVGCDLTPELARELLGMLVAHGKSVQSTTLSQLLKTSPIRYVLSELLHNAKRATSVRSTHLSTTRVEEYEDPIGLLNELSAAMPETLAEEYAEHLRRSDLRFNNKERLVESLYIYALVLRGHTLFHGSLGQTIEALMSLITDNLGLVLSGINPAHITYLMKSIGDVELPPDLQQLTATLRAVYKIFKAHEKTPF